MITALENLHQKMLGMFVGEATLGEEGSFFIMLQKVFSNEDLQAKMIELNQEQMYDEQETRLGRKHGLYAQKTLRRKRRRDGSYPERYTFEETGAFYDSLNVYAGETGVQMLTDFQIDHIASLFATYASEDDLGLNEENILSLKEDIVDGLRGEIRNYLKNSL